MSALRLLLCVRYRWCGSWGNMWMSTIAVRDNFVPYLLEHIWPWSLVMHTDSYGMGHHWFRWQKGAKPLPALMLDLLKWRLQIYDLIIIESKVIDKYASFWHNMYIYIYKLPLYQIIAFRHPSYSLTVIQYLMGVSNLSCMCVFL